MAKVKNLTPDTLSLFRADAPPVDPGGEVTVRDKNFVDRAWPKSTWDVIEEPVLEDDLAGYVDLSTDEAWLFAKPVAESDMADDGKPLADMTIPELTEYAAANGVDLDGATKKADIIAAIAAHPQED